MTDIDFKTTTTYHGAIVPAWIVNYFERFEADAFDVPRAFKAGVDAGLAAAAETPKPYRAAIEVFYADSPEPDRNGVYEDFQGDWWLYCVNGWRLTTDGRSDSGVPWEDVVCCPWTRVS